MRPAITSTYHKTIPLSARVNREETERGLDWEARALVSNKGGLTYAYKDYDLDAPKHHKLVADLKFANKTEAEIADITGLAMPIIRKILAHSPVAQHIAKLRLFAEEEMRKWHERTAEVGTKGFESIEAMLDGDKKPSIPELKLAEMAIKLDPTGRFNLDGKGKEQAGRTITGANLNDFIENAKRRKQIEAEQVTSHEGEHDDGSAVGQIPAIDTPPAGVDAGVCANG